MEDMFEVAVGKPLVVEEPVLFSRELFATEVVFRVFAGLVSLI